MTTCGWCKYPRRWRGKSLLPSRFRFIRSVFFFGLFAPHERLEFVEPPCLLHILVLVFSCSSRVCLVLVLEVYKKKISPR